MHAAQACLLCFTLLLAPILAQNCGSGEYYDGNQCTSCDSRCVVCMSSTICTVCQIQAFLTITSAGLSCEWCAQLIPGCATCETETSCSVCSEGYYLNGAGCANDANMGGQVTIASQSTCQSFQVNLNGACYPSIAFCANYNSDGTCNTCQSNSQLISGYCIPSNVANFHNAGGNEQTSQNPSLICQPRQYISNGECITIGSECLSFMVNGQCTECDVGFTLFKGLCVQAPDPNSKVIVSYVPKIHDQTVLDKLASDEPGETTNDNEVNEASAQNGQNQSDSSNSSETANGSAQSDQQSTPQCTSPCSTCSSDPTYCLSCEAGYTTVDVLPGRCFQF